MKVYAYLRVSTQLQTIDNQKHEINHWCRRNGLTISTWVTESVSGTIAWEKRKLGKLIKKMEPEDLMICTEISRLGRNMLMVMSILNYCSQHGVRIHTIKDNFDLSDSINSKIIAFAFALASEIERNLISQRTREALAIKRQAGIKLGRPKGHSEKVARMLEDADNLQSMLKAGESKTSIARHYGVHRNTLYKYIRGMPESG